MTDVEGVFFIGNHIFCVEHRGVILENDPSVECSLVVKNYDLTAEIARVVVFTCTKRQRLPVVSSRSGGIFVDFFFHLLSKPCPSVIR
jgi:hypothetical protein